MNQFSSKLRIAIVEIALLLALAGLCAKSAAADGARPQLVLLSGRPASTLNVPIGNTKTLKTTASYVDLVVGDPDVADAMPLTDRSFYIHGKKLGSTTISAYDAQKALVGTLHIQVGADTTRLGDELSRRLPGSHIRSSSINGHIMLSGTVTDAVALDKALAIAKDFGPDVINSLTVSQPQQVMLQVRFIEVSRNAGRELGVAWDVLGNQISAASGLGGPLTNNQPFGAILGHFLSKGVTADALISALQQKGLARRLAEPDLVAMSGQTASFLAGGEFPFPVQGQNNVVTIAFKKFGVGLSFTPVVLADGLISLTIAPEVSELDNTNTISVGGVTVPSLVVRRVSTNIELKDGQSFAIAGLLQNVSSENNKQLPWLGDVPVLGALFRSAAFSKNETDLAVIVTPHLVQPAKPGQNLRDPTEASAPANDIDRFLLGRQEVSAAELRVSQGRAARGAWGHILEIRSGGAHDAQN
ncbi:MAG TPA: type II and III secretion system protein family protein [Beijerinckiaceae bacterium]|nr:type II and III secretion system protein family protein [Beijerinckiaceae bacterium]HVB89594.1 type II and III secretion system protein family protein [Beijerinckiaceae bacterium]